MTRSLPLFALPLCLWASLALAQSEGEAPAEDTAGAEAGSEGADSEASGEQASGEQASGEAAADAVDPASLSHVVAHQIRIDGPMVPSQLVEAADANQAAFGTCYQEAFAGAEAAPEGDVRIRFSLTARGQVQRVLAQSGRDLRVDTFHACLTGIVEGLSFRRVPGEVPITATLPLYFGAAAPAAEPVSYPDDPPYWDEAQALATLESPHLGTLRYVPPGSYQHALADGETVEVEIRSGFYIMEAEVTQGQWEAIMGANPSWFAQAERPVERISWGEAREFARAVSQAEGLRGNQRYRMPTEAEWAWAARGGQQVSHAGSHQGAIVGWIDSTSAGASQRPCRRQRNGYGICDMTGNLAEWVDENRSLRRDPEAISGTRPIRGGGWFDNEETSAIDTRSYHDEEQGAVHIGVRLIRPE